MTVDFFVMKHKLSLIFFIISLFALSNSCSTLPKKTENTTCATRYPILLVHGVAYRDDVPIVRYWSGIPKALEQQGATVFLAHQNALASHMDNAWILRKRVLDILKETGAERINIIAHSKGGLESRLLISKLGMDDKIASLTTLATPHRGSPLADSLIALLGRKSKRELAFRIANRYARLLGDKNPNAKLATYELSNAYMQHFNKTVINSHKVYYQSYIGIAQNHPIRFFRFKTKLISSSEGANDCVVSEKSAKWGVYNSPPNSSDDFGITHFDIVGMRFVSKLSTFDANLFFIEMVAELKAKGY